MLDMNRELMGGEINKFVILLSFLIQCIYRRESRKDSLFAEINKKYILFCLFIISNKCPKGHYSNSDGDTALTK